MLPQQWQHTFPALSRLTMTISVERPLLESLPRLLSSFPALKVLILKMYYADYVSDYRDFQDTIFPDIDYPHLESLQLSGSLYTEHIFPRKFFDKQTSLLELSIPYLHLGCHSWTSRVLKGLNVVDCFLPRNEPPPGIKFDSLSIIRIHTYGSEDCLQRWLTFINALPKISCLEIAIHIQPDFVTDEKVAQLLFPSIRKDVSEIGVMICVITGNGRFSDAQYQCTCTSAKRLVSPGYGGTCWLH